LKDIAVTEKLSVNFSALEPLLSEGFMKYQIIDFCLSDFLLQLILHKEWPIFTTTKCIMDG